jgi:Ca2+-binding RTX toxin-like protein
MTVFTGAAGDDSILGTSQGDDFHLEQGGDDTAVGGGGADIFYLGAAFSGADQLDGGAKDDILRLDGDYSAGVVLTATTIRGIEFIEMAADHSYDISGLTDANLSGVASGRHIFFDAHQLGAGDSVRIDGSLLTRGLLVAGGAGNDRMIGGSGSDAFVGNGGHDTMIGGGGADTFNLNSEQTVAKGGDGDDVFQVDFPAQLGRGKIDGGAGFDTLEFTSFSGADKEVFGGRNFRAVEKLTFNNGPYNVTLADGNVAAGQVLIVDAHLTTSFAFDGSAETDGAFQVMGARAGGQFSISHLKGGSGDDTLIGSGHDNIVGGAGDDVLSGGRGRIDGGAGADRIDSGHDVLVYHSAADSTAGAMDVVSGAGRGDTFDLQAIDADTTAAGDQAFHLAGAFSGQAGELVLTFDADRHFTLLQGDVDGDGVGDLVIELKGGDFTGFDSFVL